MKLTWRRQRLRPKYRFQTSQGAVDEKETLVACLEHDGVTGSGEAAPSKLYGQTLESTEAAFERLADELGDDPFAIDAILSRCIARCDGQRAAIAAVDNALHDWVGKKLAVPVWRLLGLPRPRVQTVFTIGIADADETRKKVDEALADGFTALKVKVGTPNDCRTLELIRARFDGPLLLDANEAWSPETAAAHIRELARFRPTMIEQPLPQDDWRQFGALKGLDVAPIFADESCQRPADVVKLAGLVDGINVKFTKCGGLREALRMITLARGLNLRVMLGCFVSSSLAIAPGVAIAGLCDFADLDGALLLSNDPFEGVIAERGGILTLADRPGLGARPC
jgi:L-alanine-DL-glutamate epimerase-like enolase superfamily enzyme